MNVLDILNRSARPLPACLIAQRAGAELDDVYARLAELEASEAARCYLNRGHDACVVQWVSIPPKTSVEAA